MSQIPTHAHAPFPPPVPGQHHPAPPAGGGVQINCPVCGIPVRLPAVECPKCRANLRTGEKPEEFVPFYKRKKLKALLLVALLCLPPVLYALVADEDGLVVSIRRKLGGCAEPQPKWEEFSQDEFERKVRGGYQSWNEGGSTRTAGQSAKGPETPDEAAMSESAKAVNRDNQAFFASSLVAAGPSRDLRPQDNWYMLMPGEWDVAWIPNVGGTDGAPVAGEWIFTWINGGQAIQDVLAVPYQWQKPQAGFDPVLLTTIRSFNAKRQSWEGFHLDGRQMIYFGVSKNAQNQMVELYQLEGQPLIAWFYSDVARDSFKVTISQSVNNGASYTKVAEIWAKRRNTVLR